VGATFIQPLRRDFTRSGAEWESLFVGLQAFGIRTLILQWAEIDGLDLADDALSRIMNAARRMRAEIWIGTSYRAAWWNVLSAPLGDMQAYFQEEQARLRGRVSKLSAMLRQDAARCVKGWYVTEELDDMSWRRPERAPLLRRFLQGQSETLLGIMPLPVAISVFANDIPAIGTFATFIAQLCEDSGLGRVLVQDGTGAARRSLEEARLLGEGFRRAPWTPNTEFGMVVECFNQAAPTYPGADPVITPASPNDILQRLHASTGFGSLPLTTFSHPHHLMSHGGDEAAQVGRDLLARLGRN
jgi:hypothetical protein